MCHFRANSVSSHGRFQNRMQQVVHGNEQNTVLESVQQRDKVQAGDKVLSLLRSQWVLLIWGCVFCMIWPMFLNVPCSSCVLSLLLSHSVSLLRHRVQRRDFCEVTKERRTFSPVRVDWLPSRNHSWCFMMLEMSDMTLFAMYVI